MVHAVGDGTFMVDGRKIDRKKMMTSKRETAHLENGRMARFRLPLLL